jgi:hypothetical protein
VHWNEVPVKALPSHKPPEYSRNITSLAHAVGENRRLADADVDLTALVQTPTYRIFTQDSSALETLLTVIRGTKMTGSLTINFSQGSPNGTMEWKERIKTP